MRVRDEDRDRYIFMRNYGRRDWNYFSASSVDNILVCCRDANYLQPGIKAQTYSGASFTDGFCANAFFFKSFNNSTTRAGNLKYYFTVSNTRHPQFEANILDAAADLSYMTDSVGTSARGHMVTSLNHFNNGTCVFPLCLCLPGQGPSLSTGYNTRGASTTMTFDVTGQTIPAASSASQVTAALSTFVLVESSAELRISGNRMCAVAL